MDVNISAYIGKKNQFQECAPRKEAERVIPRLGGIISEARLARNALIIAQRVASRASVE